jgi:hypothetical protein
MVERVGKIAEQIDHGNIEHVQLVSANGHPHETSSRGTPGAASALRVAGA